MPSRHTGDIVATTGEYTTREGEKKKRYLTVGKEFTDDDGRRSLKLEALPVGPGWSGWLSIYPPKDHAARPAHAAPATARPAAPPVDDGDDIPF